MLDVMSMEALNFMELIVNGTYPVDQRIDHVLDEDWGYVGTSGSTYISLCGGVGW